MELPELIVGAIAAKRLRLIADAYDDAIRNASEVVEYFNVTFASAHFTQERGIQERRCVYRGERLPPA
jgi:hypothetical protein